jgi:hypothetical protein
VEWLFLPGGANLNVSRAKTLRPKKGETPMHDLFIALSFVIILLAPCFVASRAQSSEETA